MSMPVITPGTATVGQAATDIIESVALEQTGLSHIINAEGEKIQAVLAQDGVTTNELLDVNESVQKTIQAITKLEDILLAKLQLVSDLV